MDDLERLRLLTEGAGLIGLLGYIIIVLLRRRNGNGHRPVASQENVILDRLAQLVRSVEAVSDDLTAYERANHAAAELRHERLMARLEAYRDEVRRSA